jgi:hypothetical protein
VDRLFVAPASGGRGVASALRGYRRIRTGQVTLDDQVLERYKVRRTLRSTDRAS